MKLAIIVAAARNGVIGCNNQLPWHLPQDLKYFKAVTLGKPVIMGRKTYESIGKPLPGRTNIVITRNKDWVAAEGVIVTNSLEQALLEAQKVRGSTVSDLDEVMVIGGAEIYRSALQFADRIYLTRVDVEPQGDAFFEALDEAKWGLESCAAGDVAALVPHEFLVYSRIA
ncbi:dihydrofolate reductase [Cellvibrio fibrivorans]|uniref:Dihydrofolate reductase n=1 Tax=Cellvibrio fibrivorans TaxID=126350 RepID=A0ABU1USX1_9GAMM|nr:dihydrofolate reductase [Cellvibrio fibrivorans]MDR7088279.1 dihydrofolate reductase [Cellvibrio fibrivorans]